MASIIFYAALLWYGTPIAALAIGIYGVLYFARLLDITERQFLVAITGGIILSALFDAFYYVTSTHLTVYLYEDIFTYATLTIAPIIIVCLVYFIFIGRRNLIEKYNIDIRGLKLLEIKRLKEMHR